MSYRQVVTGVDVKCAVCDAVATAAGQQQRDSPWRAHEEMQAAAWEAESERVGVKEGLDGPDREGRTIPGKAHKCLTWGSDVLTWGSPEVR